MFLRIVPVWPVIGSVGLVETHPDTGVEDESYLCRDILE